jgi:hypothetical protein
VPSGSDSTAGPGEAKGHGRRAHRH